MSEIKYNYHNIILRKNSVARLALNKDLELDNPLMPNFIILNSYPVCFENATMAFNNLGQDNSLFYFSKRGDSTKLLKALKNKYPYLKITPTKLKRIIKQLFNLLLYFCPTYIEFNYIGWINCKGYYEHFPLTAKTGKSINPDCDNYMYLIKNQLNWSMNAENDIPTILDKILDSLYILDFDISIELFCTALFSVMRSLFKNSKNESNFSFTINSEKLSYNKMLLFAKYYCGFFMYDFAKNLYWNEFYNYKFIPMKKMVSGNDLLIVLQSKEDGNHSTTEKTLYKALSDNSIYIFVGLKGFEKLLTNLNIKINDMKIFDDEVFNHPEYM